MSFAVEVFDRLLRLNDGAFRAAVAGVDEAAARRPLAGRSSLWWVAGHLVEHRAVPLAGLGGDRTSPYPLTELFGRDVAPRADVAAPTLEDLTSEFARFGALLRARIAALGDAAFDGKSTVPGGLVLPTPHFFHFHECYHLGQLGLLRTWLGKPPLVPPEKR